MSRLFASLRSRARVRASTWWWGVAVSLWAAGAVHAQSAGPSVGETQVVAAKPWWKHVTAVPIVLYTPETQFGFGAGLMSTWQMPGAWSDCPSSVVAYGIYTTRKQTVVGGTSELHFRDDRWVLLQDLRYVDWPDRFYGIGNDTKLRDRADYTDHYAQIETEFLRRVHSRFYAGLHHQLRLSDSQGEERTGALANRPLGVGRAWWHGLGAALAWDTREGLFWPQRGSLLHADATFYRSWLGSDFSAVLLRADLRRYQPLWLDHVLALRFVASGVLGDVPIQLMPALGGPSLFRGWYQGRCATAY